MNLNDYIRDIKDFPKEGILFKDISPLLENPKAFKYSIERLGDLFDMDNVDRIAGMDARGFIFGSALAYLREKPFVPLRKKGKLPYETISEAYGLEYGKDELEIHVDAVKRRERVLLLDDLLATGGTMKAGCNLVERLGGKVLGCGFLIELEDLRGRDKLMDYDVQSVLKY